MLIIALVLAVIGLAALVFAVVTSNELVAWVCIAASVLGVVLLIIDALQERQRRETSAPAKKSADAPTPVPDEASADYDYADYPEDESGEAGAASADEETGVRAEHDRGSGADDH
ncbi:hypothetical protein [Mycobacterium kyorinense]|uniref:Transmembrane protein n=1 Tax=Mycobacterium kyorinense TaxID=487514 RepID=A0A1X1YK09_9MYCO|nr:hypothetical protein [Mycobacterium kyorinense]ORW11394.1 hypothetical protein AWC14_19080 [Mycobacterium kyorinense]